MSAPPSDPPERDSDPTPPSRPRLLPPSPRMVSRLATSTADELAVLRDDVDELRHVVGEAPDASTGRKGSGMARVLVRIVDAVDAMQAEQRRVAEARARWVRIIGIPSAAAAVAVAASLLAIMSKLFGW